MFSYNSEIRDFIIFISNYLMILYINQGNCVYTTCTLKKKHFTVIVYIEENVKWDSITEIQMFLVEQVLKHDN